MDSVIYFNANYVSSNTYVKMMWEIENKGVFGVVYNPRTKKIQMQRYVCPYNFRSVIKGNSPQLFKGNSPQIFTCSNSNLDGIKKHWHLFSDDVKNGFNLCAQNLYFAYKKYLQLDTAFANSNESLEVANDVRLFQKEFCNQVLMNQTVQDTKNEPIKAKWVSIDPSSIDTTDLPILAQKIGSEKNPIDGVEFKGKFYRIFDDRDNHTLELQVLIDENTEVISAKTESINRKVRKFVRMVKMINASGLTDFINGNFYEVKDVVRFDGKEYFIITDNNGNQHSIKGDRLKGVSVYTEPPLELTETAITE